MGRNIRALIFIVTATLALLVVAVSPSSAVRAGRVQNLQITQFHHVVVTGEDVRGLPGGENRIVQKPGGGAATGLTKQGAGTLILNNTSSNSSVDLTKTGSGTLALPRATGA